METPAPDISIGIVSLGSCALTEPDRGFPAGGAEVQLYVIAGLLAAQQDLRVTLHVADLGQPERRENRLRIKPLVRVKPEIRISACRAPQIIRRLARERHRVYVTRSASSLSGLTHIAARLAGGRHMHMCAHDDECAGLGDSTLSRPARWLQNLGLKRADLVACQTTQQIELLRSAFGIEGVLAPNVSLNLFASAADQPRDGVLWVGRDVEWKAPELFIGLARRLPDQRFTMVCQPQAGRDLQKLAAAAPKNLKLIAGLPFLETTAQFARHRVLVCTSRVEGFPNVLLQAVSAGTPVLSLSVDPDNILERFGAGFMCRGSMDELVRRCGELASAAAWERCHAGALRMAREGVAGGERLVALIRELARRK